MNSIGIGGLIGHQAQAWAEAIVHHHGFSDFTNLLKVVISTVSDLPEEDLFGDSPTQDAANHVHHVFLGLRDLLVG